MKNREKKRKERERERERDDVNEVFVPVVVAGCEVVGSVVDIDVVSCAVVDSVEEI